MNTTFERSVRASDEWYTPRWIIDALEQFDLDPCAPEVPVYATATRMIDRNEDGLLADWGGEDVRVWLNPPYSHPLIDRFMEKMALHRNGIALLFNRMDIEMWHTTIFPYADAVLVIKGRVHFMKPDGTIGENAGCGSVLVAYGRDNVEILKYSGIPGQLLTIIHG